MRTTYIGMDIHKNFIQAAAMDEKGTILQEQRFDSDISGIKRFIGNLDATKIKAAIESTCTWYHVYETLDSLDITGNMFIIILRQPVKIFPIP